MFFVPFFADKLLQDLMDSQFIKGINMHAGIQARESDAGIQADVFLLSPPVD